MNDSKSTPNSYQPAGLVSLKSYQPKPKVTCLWPVGGYYVQPWSPLPPAIHGISLLNAQLLLFNWLQQGLLSVTNSKKVMMYLINILNKSFPWGSAWHHSQYYPSYWLHHYVPATVHHSLPLPSMVYSYWLPKMMPTAPAIRDISQQDEQSASNLLECV